MTGERSLHSGVWWSGSGDVVGTILKYAGRRGAVFAFWCGPPGQMGVSSWRRRQRYRMLGEGMAVEVGVRLVLDKGKKIQILVLGQRLSLWSSRPGKLQFENWQSVKWFSCEM